MSVWIVPKNWTVSRDDPVCNSQKHILFRYGSTGVFLLFVITLFYLVIDKVLFLDIFTSRDIIRAVNWLKGNIYYPGPEMSAGKNLPGPLFYFLLSPPLFFGDNIYSQSILWMIGWVSLIYAIAFHFIVKITTHKESSLIFLLSFILVIDRGVFQLSSFGWNAGFAVLFHILSLVNIYYFLETRKNVYLYLVGIIVALGIQVHLLVCVHAVTVIFLSLLQFKKQRKSLLLFVCLVLSPIILYKALDYIYNFNTSKPSYAHYFWDIWLNGYLLFSEKAIEHIRIVFDFLYTVPVIACVLLILWKRWKTDKWVISNSTRNLCITAAIPLIVAVLTAGAFWYTYFVPVFLMLLFSKFADDLMPETADKRINFILVCGLCFFSSFIFISLYKGPLPLMDTLNGLFNTVGNHYMPILWLSLLIIMNMHWNWRSFWKFIVLILYLLSMLEIKLTQYLNAYVPKGPSETFQRNWPTYQSLHPIMERMLYETNWSAKEAVKRIYVTGIWTAVDLKAYYSLTAEISKQSRKKAQANSFYDKPTGYIIIQHLKRFVGYSETDWKIYLEKSSLLSDFLRQEIKEANLIIKNPKLYDSDWWLIPYRVTTKSAFQDGFHNVGHGYFWTDPTWLKGCAFTQWFGNKNNLYYCLILPGYLQRAGVHIILGSDILDRKTISIGFFGAALGISEFSSNNDGHFLWENIKMRLLCNKQNFHYELPNVGLNYSLQRKDPTERAKIFSSPLRLQFFIDSSFIKLSECTIVELRFKHTHYHYFRGKSEENLKQIVWDASNSHGR